MAGNNAEKKELSRTEFFEAKTREIDQKKRKAVMKGLKVIIAVAVFATIITSLFVAIVAIVAAIVSSLLVAIASSIIILLLSMMVWIIIIFCVVVPLIMYFIGGEDDVFWGSFVKEGHVKAVIVNGEFKRFIMASSGKTFSENWDIVEKDSPSAYKGPPRSWSFAGWNLVWEWPSGSIFQQRAEWRHYEESTKEVILKREVWTQYSILDFPIYIEVDAKDKNGLEVSSGILVTTRIVNPYKALFKKENTWLDIIEPLIQGVCIFYLKEKLFQETLGFNELLGLSESGLSLNKITAREYGIEIKGIYRLGSSIADKERIKVAEVKAVSDIKKETLKIKLGTEVLRSEEKTGNIQQTAMEIPSMAIRMLAHLLPENVEHEGKKFMAEIYLKELIRKDPEFFEEKYGRIYRECLDILKKYMYTSSDKYLDIRMLNNKWSFDAISILLALELMEGKD